MYFEGYTPSRVIIFASQGSDQERSGSEPWLAKMRVMYVAVIRFLGGVHSPRVPGLILEYLWIPGFATAPVRIEFSWFALSFILWDWITYSIWYFFDVSFRCDGDITILDYLQTAG